MIQRSTARMKSTIRKMRAFVTTLMVLAGCTRFDPPEPPPTIQPTHIVLISIDTCRADHLGCYGRSPSFTPHLDALAKQGILFKNVIAPAPLTLPSHSSMLTGTIPPYHGVRDNGTFYLDSAHVTLPEILKDNGFVTGGIVSAFVLDSRYGLDQGFSDYNDRFDNQDAVERQGEETTRYAIDWLERHGEDKGFLFLHYFDPHMDYAAPAPWNERIPDQPYLAEIAYTDECVGKLIQKLKDLEIYKSTLLIVSSDHGEMLDEHGEVTHSYFVYESAIRVPWLIKLPGSTDPKIIDSLVGIVDIAPTICGLLGIDMPAPIQGMDLSSQIWRKTTANLQRPQYCESVTPTKYNANPLLSLVNSQWKYIHTTRPELYDLRSDPTETTNLADQEPVLVTDMARQLETLLQTVSPPRKNATLVHDEQALESLRSLGYVGGAVPNNDTRFSIDSTRNDPKDVFQLHDLASQVHGHYTHKEYAQARAICKKILSLAPGISEAHFMLAKIAMEENNYAKAVKHLSQTITIHPDDPIAHNRLGRALWEQGHPEHAIRAYRRALEIHPLLPEVHGDLGVLLVRTGEHDEGIQHLRQAVELKPESGVAQRLLADTLSSQKQLTEASYHYNQAIEINAKDTTAHFNLARISSAQQRPTEAIKHLRRAIAVNAELGAAQQMLAELLQAKGMALEALVHFQYALELNPDSVALMNNVAWILATHPDGHVRQAEKALRLAKRAAEQTNHANPHLLDTLAAAYANAKQYAEAVKTVTTGLMLTKPDQEALNKQMRAHLELYQRRKPYRESW